MTQIVNKRVNTAQALTTLGDNGIIDLDNKYDGLSHKAFLFEYRMTGTISTALIADYLTTNGIQICLVKAGLSGADLDTILTGAEITDISEHSEVPERQKLFAIARIILRVITSATDGTFDFELIFKPKSRGGIPFMEGSGWEVVVINRTGSALTTGNNIANMVIHERFAYEGGGK